MAHFDDIPINKIKTMVGYQTNADMYRADAKLPEQEQEQPNHKMYDGVKDEQVQQSDDSDNENVGLSIEERLQARKWKTRLRACKDINTIF